MARDRLLRAIEHAGREVLDLLPGAYAGSPLVVGARQTGRTISTSGWSAEPPIVPRKPRPKRKTHGNRRRRH
jgi:hypothetical protein